MRLILFILIFFPLSLNGQSSYLDLSLIGGFGYSKSNLENPSSSFFNQFRGSLPLSKGIIGENYGLEIGFNTKSNRFTFFIRNSVKGQKTSIIFIPRHPNPDSLNWRNTAGGTYFKLTHTSTEFGLNYFKKVGASNFFEFYVSGGASIDITDKLTFQNFTLIGNGGYVDLGCCRKKYYVSDNYLNRVSGNIKNGAYRLGFSLSIYCKILLTKDLFLLLQPEVQLLTDYIVRSQSVLNGRITSIRVQSGIGFNF